MTVSEASTIDRRSEAVRRVAVALVAVSAIIYYLIGFGVLDVGGLDSVERMAFGLIAGTAFALGAFMLARAEKRVMFVLAALGMAFVIWAYFDIAPDRDPAYETWGIVLRVIQFPTLALLGYLAVRLPPSRIVE